MAILVDQARWPFRGRLFAHLVSDTSLAELHAFARRLGLPSRAFSGDHYDIPAEARERALAAGARAVASREIIESLRRAGLRPRKRQSASTPPPPSEPRQAP